MHKFCASLLNLYILATTCGFLPAVSGLKTTELQCSNATNQPSANINQKNNEISLDRAVGVDTNMSNPLRLIIVMHIVRQNYCMIVIIKKI